MCSRVPYPRVALFTFGSCWQWIVPTVEVATPRLSGKLFSHSIQDDVLATEDVWIAGVGIVIFYGITGTQYRNGWWCINHQEFFLPYRRGRILLWPP